MFNAASMNQKGHLCNTSTHEEHIKLRSNSHLSNRIRNIRLSPERIVIQSPFDEIPASATISFFTSINEKFKQNCKPDASASVEIMIEID